MEFSKTMRRYETREEKRKEIKKDENYILLTLLTEKFLFLCRKLFVG